MNPQQSNDIIKQIVRQETIDKVPEGFSTRLMERLHASETIKNNHVPFFHWWIIVAMAALFGGLFFLTNWLDISFFESTFLERAISTHIINQTLGQVSTWLHQLSGAFSNEGLLSGIIAIVVLMFTDGFIRRKPRHIMLF
jgi:hypothetical protein